jgi:cytoskeletal protein CcmA (bactofilin family)
MWGKTTDSWGKTTERESRLPVSPQPLSTTMGQEHSPAPPAPVLETPRITAAFGKTMKVRGEIYCEEELYLDGEIEGTLEVRNRLTIGPNGKIRANVKVKELVVSGSIQGDVEAADRIAIKKGASIVGDVKTAGIVIEDGAYFKGGIDILRAEDKKPDAKKPEAKQPETASNVTSTAARAQRAAT